MATMTPKHGDEKTSGTPAKRSLPSVPAYNLVESCAVNAPSSTMSGETMSEQEKDDEHGSQPPCSPSLLKVQKSSPSLLGGAHHAVHHGRGLRHGFSASSGLTIAQPGIVPGALPPGPSPLGGYSHAHACASSPPFGSLRSRSNSLTTDSLGIAMASSPYRARLGVSSAMTPSNAMAPMVSPRSCPTSPAIPFVPALGVPGVGMSSGIVAPAACGRPSAAASAAGELERNRAREREKEELTMSADQLRAALRKERGYSCKLAMDLAALKSAAVSNQAEAEVHEEGRINCLMKRLDSLSREKGRILIELEREEEMLTNTLQKKLNQVRREKAELEKHIRREQADVASQSRTTQSESQS